MIDSAVLHLDGRARPCGICGDIRRLSKTHVPPKAAGNTAGFLRALMVSDEEGFRPGRWEKGGMWVYGLCRDCNLYAGSNYDQAYASFSNAILRWHTTRTVVSSRMVQAISFAPGRVSRAALSGLLGLSPHIRALHPSLAYQLEAGGPVIMPGGLSLMLALYLGEGGQLAGPMLSGIPDGSGQSINTLASFTFRPLSWALATSETAEFLLESSWVDANEWLRYENDRESVDLRYLHPRGVPQTSTILHAPGADQFTLYSKEIATMVVGRMG